MNRTLTLILANGLLLAVVMFGFLEAREKPGRPALAKAGLFGVPDCIVQLGRYGRWMSGSREILEINLPLRMTYQKDPLSRLIGKQTRTFDEYMRLIEEASRDNVVSGILLVASETALDFAEVEDLRSALLRFKARGKSVYVYFESGGNKEYLLSSASDHIMGAKTAGLFLVGVKTRTLYLKDLLDKLGIRMWVIKEGAYKTFGDMFTRSNMSESDKEQLGSLVDDLYERLMATISKERRLDRQVLERAVQKAPLTSSEAKDLGLFDSVGYRDDLKRIVKEHQPHRVRFVDFKDYRVRKLFPVGNPFKKRIALLHLSGMILPGESQDMPMLRTRAIVERPTLELLEEIEKDRSIDALMVRIDSPGGLESPTDQIWRKIRKLGEKKPVIVQAGGVCASGGYYIASGGHKVIAPPYSVVGSIGVLAFKPEASVLADKLGLRSETIRRGDHADIFSPWRGWSQEELERLKANILHDYDMFLEAVAVSRGRPKEEIAKLAQGRIYSGEAAFKLGLVDRLGGFFEALDETKKAIGLRPQDAAEMVVFPKERGLFEALAQGPLAYQDPYIALFASVGCASRMLDMFGKQQTAVLWPVLFQLE